MSHVSYDETADFPEGRFDGDCPASHPIKLPEIHLYFRILGYDGGQHTFSDGSDIFHADYFSGWDAAELQKVLDECSNCMRPPTWLEPGLEARSNTRIPFWQTRL